MRLTLRQLEIFCGIAQSGSTVAAAQTVHLSQSATSTALSELEHVIGALLFDRVGKRLLLNDNGRTLLPTALALLDGAREIEVAFASPEGPPRIDLRLYASTTIGNYVLPAALAAFRATNPRVRLDLRIGNTNDVMVAIRDFVADLGLIEGPCHDSSIVVIPWLEDELVIAAAPLHPLTIAARRGRLTGAQLGEAQWLLREPGSGTREAVEQALLPHLASIRSSLTLGSSEAIKNAAAEGLGVCCLSRRVVDDLVRSRRLCVLSTALPALTRRFALIHHERKVMSASLRRFIAHCTSAGDKLPPP